MKRLLIITLLCVLLLPVMASAADAPKETPNAKRIAELQSQMKDILVDVQGLQAQRAQIDQQIANLQNEFAKKQGAIEELQRQDTEAAKKPGK